VIEDVLSEEHLAFSALESTKVHGFAGHPCPSRIEFGDLTDRDEHLAPTNPNLQADYWRVAAAAQPDDDIVNAAERLTGLIDERASDDLSQAEQSLSRGAHQIACST
jgi:hypothetical protein